MYVYFKDEYILKVLYMHEIYMKYTYYVGIKGNGKAKRKLWKRPTKWKQHLI